MLTAIDRRMSQTPAVRRRRFLPTTDSAAIAFVGAVIATWALGFVGDALDESDTDAAAVVVVIIMVIGLLASVALFIVVVIRLLAGTRAGGPRLRARRGAGLVLLAVLLGALYGVVVVLANQTDATAFAAAAAIFFIAAVVALLTGLIALVWSLLGD